MTAGGTSDADLPAELFACHADADCVATRPGGCCFNGRMTAVNASKVDAYAKASPCGKPHPICPQYRVQENRVPRCNTARQRCEMVNP